MLGNSEKNGARTSADQSEIAGDIRGSFVSPVTGEKLTYGKPWGLTGSSRRLNGSIYFIGGETGCIKIGWTGQSAGQRCKDLQTGSPIKLSVLAVARGGMSIEQDYHRRFKTCRSHGEWFERTPELLAEIDRLNETTKPESI